MGQTTELQATITCFLDQFAKQKEKLIKKLSEQKTLAAALHEIEGNAAEREVLRLQALHERMQSCAPAIGLLTGLAQKESLNHSDIFQAHDTAIDIAVDMVWSIDEAPRASTASARESFFCMYTTIQAYQSQVSVNHARHSGACATVM